LTTRCSSSASLTRSSASSVFTSRTAGRRAALRFPRGSSVPR
jgi:hypothetical protein